jgi:hypothetical protein
MKRSLAILVLSIATVAGAADITDPLARNFCNEKVRVTADEFVSLYKTCTSLVAFWNANPSLATLLPNVLASIGVDGASVGGSTTFTSAGAAFVAAQAGHSIKFTARGAGTCTLGVYEIASRTNATTLVLASSPCSVSGTGITYEVGDFVVDGSATDGREPITGTDATAIVTYCTAFVADMDASGFAKRNGVNGVAVNGAGRF